MDFVHSLTYGPSQLIMMECVCPLSEHCDLCSLDKASIMGRQILPVICFNKHLLEETEQWERDDGRDEREKRQKWQNYRKSGKQVCGCRLAVIKDNIC